MNVTVVVILIGIKVCFAVFVCKAVVEVVNIALGVVELIVKEFPLTEEDLVDKSLKKSNSAVGVILVLFGDSFAALIKVIEIDCLAFFEHAENKTDSKFSYVEFEVGNETVKDTN